MLHESHKICMTTTTHDTNLVQAMAISDALQPAHLTQSIKVSEIIWIVQSSDEISKLWIEILIKYIGGICCSSTGVKMFEY